MNEDYSSLNEEYLSQSNQYYESITDAINISLNAMDICKELTNLNESDIKLTDSELLELQNITRVLQGHCSNIQDIYDCVVSMRERIEKRIWGEEWKN